MSVPAQPKLYHIAHVDRLPSIVADQCLWCDREVARRAPAGTTIGMNSIKQRRLSELRLSSHPDLFVGDCVPFYFCPRSVMLYVVYMGNMPDLPYRGGQRPIVHLELDLHRVAEWCQREGLRWAFTLGNAGARFFEDRADMASLTEVNWDAVRATDWRDPDVKEGKQAEFLVEGRVDWGLVERIGVKDASISAQAQSAVAASSHAPTVAIMPSWYYSETEVSP